MDPVIEMAERPAAPALAGVVSGYRGYRTAGLPPGTHRGLPSGVLTTIFGLDRPVEILEMPDRRQRPGAFSAFTGGLHAVAARVANPGEQRGVHVDVTPLGARVLFGMPAAALASTVVDLEAVLGPDAARIHEQIVEAPSWTACFEILDRELTRVVARRDAVDPPRDVVWAWDHLRSTGGRVAIGEMAAETGWSRRHFGERFRREFGLTPKVVARVLRFERACGVLRSRPTARLADVAAACGYYDQAHFTREWREIAGCTPTAWLREELPFVQDSTASPV